MRFSVAPMMDRTDRHCRYFYRLMTRHTLLYTEMVTSDAILHGDRDRLLGFDEFEHNLALQLGGSDPAKMALAAQIGADFGYDEININCGCPSDRVKSGFFGACLMAEPGLVARSIEAMKSVVSVPVTVKCRIGIDEQDSEADLTRFVQACVDAGVDGLIVHARKAWLQGLSPKDNRSIPPLDYGRVYRLKQQFPALPLSINGGIESLEDALEHLAHCDGVMLGRAVWDNPSMLMKVDQRVFQENQLARSLEAVLEAYKAYCEAWLRQGVPLARLVRPIIPLYQGVYGARHWRRILTVEAVKPGAHAGVIDAAMRALDGLPERYAG